MAILARRMNAEGKYYYGTTGPFAPELGLLISIDLQGDGQYPPGPPNPATQEEHDQWLGSLRQRGFKVTETPHPGDEPTPSTA